MRRLPGDCSDGGAHAGHFREPAGGLGATLKWLRSIHDWIAFPNAQIPVSRWSPVAARILAYPQFPAPNAAPALTTPGAFVNTVDQQPSGRINRHPHRSQRLEAVALFGRYSFLDSTTFRPAPFNGYAEGSTTTSSATR